MRFNTAISQMMIFSNHVQSLSEININTLKTFLLLLNPFIPHMAEEINEHMNAYESLSYAEWPNFDPEIAKLTKTMFSESRIHATVQKHKRGGAFCSASIRQLHQPMRCPLRHNTRQRAQSTTDPARGPCKWMKLGDRNA